jgi:hypothetical protein
VRAEKDVLAPPRESLPDGDESMRDGSLRYVPSLDNTWPYEPGVLSPME